MLLGQSPTTTGNTWTKDNWYCLMAQLFHREILGALSAENVDPYGLPDELVPE